MFLGIKRETKILRMITVSAEGFKLEYDHARGRKARPNSPTHISKV